MAARARRNTLALSMLLGGATLAPTLQSCTPTEKVDPKPVDVVPDVFKEYVHTPKDGEFYINIKDSKVDINGALHFKVKENVTKGTKEVTLQFDAGKLRTELEKIFELIKSRYT